MVCGELRFLQPVGVPAGEGDRLPALVEERDEVYVVCPAVGPDSAAVGAADDQPLPLGAAEVGDHDGASGALGGEHQRFPAFVPRLDGVVEVLDLLEVSLFWTRGEKCVEGFGVRAVLRKGLSEHGQVGQVGAVPFPAPAALHASNGKEAVCGTRAAGAHAGEEAPVVIRQPHSYLRFEVGEPVIGQWVFQDPLMPVRAEHLAARRLCTQRDHTLTDTIPLLINHAQTVRGATDIGPALRGR